MQTVVDLGPAPEIDGHMPRWRRPSLMEARKADPTRFIAADAKLTFDGRASAAVMGLERRRIRYRLVSLLDEPDEVRGVEIGSLDEGDEVVLVEKRGTYRRVLCPDGRDGWVHKMTLGDVVIDAAAATDSWTSGDEAPPVRGVRGRPAPVSRVTAPVLRRGLTGSLERPEPALRPVCRSAASATPGCAGARCSARRTVGSRTVAAASPPGTRRCRPWEPARHRRRGPRGRTP